ncbi:MAG: hypothetical protein JWO38_5581 [Gemmataceae bacterium]|nr:hypothetical protein [Gemmataceae bacterium]
MEPTVELTVAGPATGRGPVTVGVPWPRGALPDPAQLGLRDARGNTIRLQARALDRWPDCSVRWVLLDWQAEAGAGPYTLSAGGPIPAAGSVVRVAVVGGIVTVETGPARFELGVGSAFPFRSATVGGGSAVDADRTRFLVEHETGRVFSPVIETAEVEEPGPVRVQVCLRGQLEAADGRRAEPLGDFVARLHFFAGSATVRFDLTIRNPERAEHPGGLWDLGDPGSLFLKDASLTVALPVGAGEPVVRCSPEVDAPFEQIAGPLELYQDSSGGENWKSVNHINCDREIPVRFRGYHLRTGGQERTGLRATPAVVVTRGVYSVGTTMPWFWQNFPKTIEATGDTLTLRLFPRQSAAAHELQGGEQKTHTFSVSLGEADPTAALTWFREPARAAAPPAWYCAAGVVPYLTPRADDPNADYLALVDAAVEGPDTFDRKREVIDEFGWRHFGDIYGDHEAVYHAGPGPMVSHYNNQYDPVAGFGYQYLRGGDARWLRHMDELAAHVADIDIYHTDRDKSAYNHGLFWHTYHYAPADTATHRSYPRALRQLKGMPGLDPDDPKAKASRAAYALGGGPGNEQNYTTGLVLHHYLTGSAASRETAVELARWVIDMDDGRRTVFRWLAGGDTGLASQSRDPGYHGPGRGSGNSLAALLDGHRLTGDPAFLAKADQLVRRCIHPADDVPARNLLDVENRWFYTMFLHSLGRYLDYKAERGELDETYAYARASLLHYARWMADHERPYLERPEILEYPNETWAAQDMRKSEVFRHAARHASGAEKTRFRERTEFFFRDSVARLRGFETRTLSRPVVLLLSLGYGHAHLQKHPNDSAPPPAVEVTDFGTPERFVPQKVRALARFKKLVAIGGAVFAAGVVLVALFLLRRQ